MIRRAFNVAFVLSLALCITIVIVWAWPQSAIYSLSGPYIRLGNLNGHFGFCFVDHIRCAPGLRSISQPLPPPQTNAPQPPWGGSFGGFRLSRETGPYSRVLRVEMPWWLAVILPASLALIFRRLRPLRLAPDDNLCRSCGYDLRATERRCPECGTIVPAKMVAGNGDGYGCHI
jgi:predicted RNA-binding Zn-ribbon protein involved in translation (DUF1610 family)